MHKNNTFDKYVVIERVQGMMIVYFEDWDGGKLLDTQQRISISTSRVLEFIVQFNPIYALIHTL